MIWAIYVPGHARHDENLGPPGDYFSILIDYIDIAGVLRIEGDVIGAKLGKLHGIVAVQTAGDPDAAALAKAPARLRIKHGIGDMHAVGAEALGKINIAGDEAGKTAALHEIDQAAGVSIVN